MAAIKLMWLTPLLNPPYVAVLQILVGCAAVVLVIGLWKWRCRVEASVVSAAATAGICLALSCAAPFWVNGSGYFAQRFAIYWVIFLLVAAAAAKPPRWCATVIGGIALGAAPIVILFQSSALSSATRQLSVVMDAPLVPTGSLGVIVSEPGRGARFGADFVRWSAAHWFRRSQAILTNAVWMDLPMIMLRPKETYPWTYSDDLEAPERVLAGLDRAGGLRVAVRVREGGPLTHGLLQRLGFRVVSSTPEVAFYSCP
jgi:hypothetical protein